MVFDDTKILYDKSENVAPLRILKMIDLEISPGRFIGDAHPCYIIAEIGQNHQGSLEIAKKLIYEAKKCGADCVKFQKSSLQEKFTEGALCKEYEGRNSWGRTYGQHKEHLEFSEQEYVFLSDYAKEQQITFTASAMDEVSLAFLNKLNVPFIKIGSGDADNVPLIERAANMGKVLLISTGMQNMDWIREIYKIIRKRHKRFALLHCISSYPTDVNEINLRVLETFKKEFSDINIGYSGHEMGTAVCVAAVALGAKIIERHITLDKTQKGSDHTCSLDPFEFATLVKDIRMTEQALGHGEKTFQHGEIPCYEKLGKSLVASQDLLSGTILRIEHMKVKVSLPKGIPAREYYTMLGKKLASTVSKDCPLQYSDFFT